MVINRLKQFNDAITSFKVNHGGYEIRLCVNPRPSTYGDDPTCKSFYSDVYSLRGHLVQHPWGSDMMDLNDEVSYIQIINRRLDKRPLPKDDYYQQPY